MPARKRGNAFEDFPVTPKDEPASIPASGTGVTEGGAPQPIRDTAPTGSAPSGKVERIERLKPTQMLPDRFQPRRLLPSSLREPFFTRQVNCYQTAAQWLTMAKNDRGIQIQVEGLLAMGSSFGEHGQIKAITGNWEADPSGAFFFRIETGERRFWAACLQFAAHHGQPEPELRVEVVEKPTRARQVLENQHSEAPSAVGRACEVASLILAEKKMDPPTSEKDEFDYFRQARQQAMTGDLWDQLSTIMQLTRPRMIQLLNILALPTPLLEMADRHRIPERVLREILAAPRGQWEAILKSSIQNNLTADDVAEITQKSRPGRKEGSATHSQGGSDPAQNAISALKRFTYQMEELDEDMQAGVLDVLADDLVANSRAEGLVNLMHDLAERIRVRQESRRRYR